MPRSRTSTRSWRSRSTRPSRPSLGAPVLLERALPVPAAPLARSPHLRGLRLPAHALGHGLLPPHLSLRGRHPPLYRRARLSLPRGPRVDHGACDRRVDRLAALTGADRPGPAPEPRVRSSRARRVVPAADRRRGHRISTAGGRLRQIMACLSVARLLFFVPPIRVIRSGRIGAGRGPTRCRRPPPGAADSTARPAGAGAVSGALSPDAERYGR